jgi:hypothetical protein
MSERREIAERLAQFIRDNNLANPFGGDVENSKDKRHYAVLFSVPAILDGIIRVYSPKFIAINCQGRLCNHDAVYDSEANATEFMRLAFVASKFDAAYAVPVKPEKIKS